MPRVPGSSANRPTWRLSSPTASRSPTPDRDQGDGDRGEQLEHQRGEERDPEGGHRRGPVPVRDPAQDRHLGVGRPVGSQRRQAGHHVGEPVREAPEHRPAAVPVGRRQPPDQDHEHRDQGHRDQDGEPRDGVHPEQADHHGERHDRSQRQLREVAPEVPVERVEAAGREKRDLRAWLVGGPARTHGRGPLEELHPEGGLDRAADPLGDDVRRPAQERPQQQDHAQRRQRPAQPLDAQAARERAADRGREEPGLRHGKQRGRHPEGDGREERSRSRHDRRRGAGDGGSRMAVGTRPHGQASTPARGVVTRLRNT